MYIIAGPCAIENYNQVKEIAEAVKDAGATHFRGGVFKPRSSPDAFQGVGEEGLYLLEPAKALLPVVSEATQIGNVSLIAAAVDIIQVGSRNMHNIELLRAVAQTNKPILLKRGYAALIEEEWLKAAAYIRQAGNNQILMCERGIRTFEPYTRNTLDLAAVGAVHALTAYDVIIDPSHAAGRPELVIPFALAGLAAGADGVMIEVHNNPAHARCDGHQALTPREFADAVPLMKEVYEICCSQ